MLFPSVRDVACYQQVCEAWSSTLRSRLKATPLKELASGGGPPARTIWDAVVAHAGMHELILRERFSNAVIACGTTAKARQLLGGGTELISPTRELLATIDRCRKLKYVKSEADSTDVNDATLKALHAQWLDAVVRALPRVVVHTAGGLPMVCVEENEHCILKLGGDDGAAWRELLASPLSWVDHIRDVVHTPFPDKGWRVSSAGGTGSAAKGTIEEVVLPVLEKLAATVHDLGVVATVADIEAVKGRIPDDMVVVFQCGPRTHAVRGADNALDCMRAVVSAKTRTQNDSMDRFLEEAAVHPTTSTPSTMHMHAAVRALVDMDVPFQVESTTQTWKEERCDCVDGAFNFSWCGNAGAAHAGAAASSTAVTTEVAIVTMVTPAVPHHAMTTNDWARLFQPSASVPPPPPEFLAALLTTHYTLHCSVEDVGLTQPPPGALFGGPSMLVCPPCAVLRLFTATPPMASPVIAARGQLAWVADTTTGHDPASSIVVVRNQAPVWRVFRVSATGTIEFPLRRWIAATCGMVSPTPTATTTTVARVVMNAPRFDVVGAMPGVLAMAALHPPWTGTNNSTQALAADRSVSVLTDADIQTAAATDWCVSARHVGPVRVRDCWPGEVVSAPARAAVCAATTTDAPPPPPYLFRIGPTELPIVTRKALGVWSARFVPYKTHVVQAHPIDDRVCTLLNRQATSSVHPWKALWAQRGRVPASAWSELRRLNGLDVDGLHSVAKLRGLNLMETQQSVRPVYSRATAWSRPSEPLPMFLHTHNWHECSINSSGDDGDDMMVVMVQTAPDTYVAFTEVGVVTTDMPSSQCAFAKRVTLTPTTLPMTAALQLNLAPRSPPPTLPRPTATAICDAAAAAHIVGWVMPDDDDDDTETMDDGDDDVYDTWRALRYPNARPVRNKECDLWDPFFVLQKHLFA